MRITLLELPFLVLLAAAGTALAASRNGACKLTPNDAAWPTDEEWNALNATINGTLIRTTPAASSCYPGNPFNAPTNCTDVTTHWSYAAYHAAWPESIDYSIFTNHSCLPPGVDGYVEARGCRIGALPVYIVNAKNEAQIGIAMKWADDRNIRVVIKGTGHDMNGRSTGAYALSIWTHNLNHFRHDPAWRIPGTNSTADVAVLGSGNNWGSAYTAVHSINRTLVGGEDATVGLGGLVQNGGHGLLSSTHGLASDSLYQVTIITPDGRRLVANDVQNKDLFWAVRGAGGGQFGVATEFVLATHPLPENVVTGGLTFYANQGAGLNASDASLDALVETARSIPDLMDSGLTGTVMALTGTRATSLLGLSGNESLPGVAGVISLTKLNFTIASMNTTLNELASRLSRASRDRVTVALQTISSQSYWSSTKPSSLASQSAGASSMISSRLLGRRELVDTPRDQVRHYLRQILTPHTGSSGSMALFGLQGGPATARTPVIRRGSVHPAWRRAYAHLMTYGAPVNDSADAKAALETGAGWYEGHIEPVWREWTGEEGGSYANEGNVFSSTWKEDFYGPRDSGIYEKLLGIKKKYDPKGSLFVWGGVGSDEWEYNLHTGLLCQA
ncbi:putative isoamyl alcohol oxidase [Aspergillus foveolatus]|uniref:putative isoamyl alcohol oxidase n=1 Tax=Aspergillus foveolatus TaxID=210207 RepID=UPI003CCC9677